MELRQVISQYREIQIELGKIQEDIKRTEESIVKVLEEGTVVDKVTGGEGGLQGFKIEGFPIKEFERRKKKLRSKVDRLKAKETDLIEISEEIEKFIDNIPVSRDRIIFRGVYLEKKTQQQIANELHIERSLVSKTISKYL